MQSDDQRGLFLVREKKEDSNSLFTEQLDSV